MALGKSNPRIRSHILDNFNLKIGAVPAWTQIGKTNRAKLMYEIDKNVAVMTDESEVGMPSVRRAWLELDLAQTHPEEMKLIDDILATGTCEAWGQAGTIGEDICEIYIPEVEISGGGGLESPAGGGNMNIPIVLTANPQSAIVGDVGGSVLPEDTNQGAAVAFVGFNEFFAYWVTATE